MLLILLLLFEKLTTVFVVLFIREDKNERVPHFTVADDSMQFLSGLVNTIDVR